MEDWWNRKIVEQEDSGTWHSLNEIVKCLNLCASSKTMLLVKILLEKNAQYITPTETAAVMVNININIDMTNNERRHR